MRVTLYLLIILLVSPGGWEAILLFSGYYDVAGILAMFTQLIGAVVDWDPVQCRLSPGTRVKALIINLLVDRQSLLSRGRFYRDQYM